MFRLLPRSDQLTRPPHPCASTVTGPTTSSVVMSNPPRNARPKGSMRDKSSDDDSDSSESSSHFDNDDSMQSSGAARKHLKKTAQAEAPETSAPKGGARIRKRRNPFEIFGMVGMELLESPPPKPPFVNAASTVSGGAAADDDDDAGSTSGDKFQQPDDAEEEDGEEEEAGEESEEDEETAGPAASSTNSFPDNGSPRTATKGKRSEAARLGFDNAGDAWKRGADKRVGVQTARLDPGAIAPVQTEGDEISVRGPTALPRRPPARPATRASRPAAYPPRPSPPGPTLAHVHLRSATRRSPRSSRARATSFSRSCGRTSSKAPS